jgi:hypothetical protein
MIVMHRDDGCGGRVRPGRLGALREKTAACTATVDEWEYVTVAMNFD